VTDPHCSNCGAPIKFGDDFCGKCGGDIHAPALQNRSIDPSPHLLVDEEGNPNRSPPVLVWILGMVLLLFSLSLILWTIAIILVPYLVPVPPVFTLLFSILLFALGTFAATVAVRAERKAASSSSVPRAQASKILGHMAHMGRPLNRELAGRTWALVTVVVMIVSAFAFLAYVVFSVPACGMGCPGEVVRTYAVTLTKTGTVGSAVAYPWALSSCLTASPCNAINFSVRASSAGLATNDFGLKIVTQNGNVVTGWKAIIWNAANGNVPMATFSSGNISWSCLTTTCPVGNLPSTGLLIITPQGLALVGTGDTLQTYGLGSISISGQTTL